MYGWIHDRLGRKLTLKVLLDGEEVGEAEMGYSRTDVTEAVPTITNPNIGFRYGLNYREFAYGIHTLEVLVSTDGDPPVQLSKRDLVVVDRMQTPVTRIPYVDTGAAPMSADANLSGWLDGPPGLQSVFYNPLAQLWLEFRNQVVRNYITQFATIAAKSCIPKSKVYSHQIAPTLYGSWNSDVLAADASRRNSDDYSQGPTLYGGAALGGAFLGLKQRLNWGRYAVNEMHPITPLADAEYAAMFDMHRTGGALFVAPYYLSALPDRLPPGSDLERFRIAPDNVRYGSDRYFRSIRSVMMQ
jgi:hypothetical protein